MHNLDTFLVHLRDTTDIIPLDKSHIGVDRSEELKRLASKHDNYMEYKETP